MKSSYQHPEACCETPCHTAHDVVPILTILTILTILSSYSPILSNWVSILTN